MITAETITDEQIRELRAYATARFERGVDTDEDRAAYRAAYDASIPHMLLATLSDEDHAETMAARARCAAILNARAKEQR